MASVAVYDEEPPDYGDVIPVAKFISACKNGMFIDYDGNGEPMKDGKVDSHITIWPSTVGEIPADCTHILWFNR